MISPEEFAILNQNAQRFYASQAKAAPKKKTGWRNSSPTAFLSEGSAMAGAGIGATIGAPLGPLGMLIGGGIGAGVAGFGGKLAEDKIRDDEWDFKDAGIEGAVSGVMGASPLRLAKGGFSGAKAAVKGGSLDDAIMAANNKVLTGKGFTSGAGDQLENFSDAMRTKSFRFKPSQITNFKEKQGEDIADVLKRYKITKPEDIDAKGILPRQQGYDEVVGMLGGIKKTDIMANLKAAYEPLIKSSSLENQATGRALKKQANEINKKLGNRVEVPAQEANALKKEFDEIVGYTDKKLDRANFTVNKHAADAFRDAINAKGDALKLTNAQGQSVKQLGLELSKLRDIRKSVQKQLGLGRGAQTMRLTDSIVGATVGAAAGAPAGIAAAVGTHAINSPLGTRTLANVSGGLGKATQAVGGGLDRLGASVAGAPARVGATGMAVGAMNGMSQPSSLEDAMMGAQDGEQVYQTNPDGSYSPTSSNNYTDSFTASQAAQSAPVESSPYSKERLIADIKRDPKNASDYIGLYKELSEIFMAPEASTKGKNSTASGVIADTKTGLNALSALSGSISENGANFPGIGFIRGKNPFDSNAQQLQAEIATARQIVGKALEGGVLRKEDEVKYKKILPTINDTDSTAQYKLQYLQQLISQRLAEYEANLQGGGGGDLADYMAEIQQQQAAY